VVFGCLTNIYYQCHVSTNYFLNAVYFRITKKNKDYNEHKIYCAQSLQLKGLMLQVGLSHVDQYLSVSSADLPPGCSAVVYSNGSTLVYWNQQADSPPPAAANRPSL
jgi:hypothetical protein